MDARWATIAVLLIISGQFCNARGNPSFSAVRRLQQQHNSQQQPWLNKPGEADPYRAAKCVSNYEYLIKVIGDRIDREGQSACSREIQAAFDKCMAPFRQQKEAALKQQASDRDGCLARARD